MSPKKPTENDEAEDRPRLTYTREGLEEAGAGLLQALGDGLGVLLDRSRSEIETVARTGKVRYDLLQAQRDRDALLRKLGREVYRLVERGDLDLPQLSTELEHLRDAHARVAELEREAKQTGPQEPEYEDPQ